MSRPDWLTQWFNQLIKDSHFALEWIPLSRSHFWSHQNGSIHHLSDHFFSIVGTQWQDLNGQNVTQPLIHQPEIGTIGFLIRNGDEGKELLVQAKIEPGNVGIVQLAPTCQTTQSNSKRIHGGSHPPFSKVFNSKKTKIIAKSLQSEQGSRFLGKRNCNILANTDQDYSPIKSHRWLATEKLLKFITQDFLINTDARSVLVSSHWEKLIDWKPFTKSNDAFAKDLAHSYEIKPNQTKINHISNVMVKLRGKLVPPKILPIGELLGWKITPMGMFPSKGYPFSIKHLKVTAIGREVSTWDQPIIDSHGYGSVRLYCGRDRGLLKFLCHLDAEPGLCNQVELGPSLVIEPGNIKQIPSYIRTLKGKIKISTLQSDEGGRFFEDVTRYRLTDIGQLTQCPSDYYWLTLSEIRYLLSQDGVFTNEARSAFSLLLKWL